MDKTTISHLLNEGHSISEIACSLHKTISSIRYWMKKFDLHANFRDGRRTWTELEMRHAISNSTTISDVLKELCLGVRPGNYETVRRFIAKNDISIGHLTGKVPHGFSRTAIPLQDILKEKSGYSRSLLKKRIIKQQLLSQVCDICKIGTEWNGQKLVLVLDHINGTRDDNRIENLRLLCPNCNSQQPTFCGKNKKITHKCIDCGSEISRLSKRCIKCNGIHYRQIIKRKVENRPSKEEMEQLIPKHTWVELGRMYGVSDNATKKWARQYGINLTPRRKSPTI